MHILSLSESATGVPSSQAAHMAAGNVSSCGIHSDNLTTTEGSRCFTEEDVILLTRDLYGRGDVGGASRLLSQFQTRPEAWNICLRLVLRCAPCRLEDKQAVSTLLRSPAFDSGSESAAFGPEVVPEDDREMVAFFAAQTICVLCESGAFEKLSGASDAQDHAGAVQRILAELLWCYRDVQIGPVGRQLASAVAAAALFEISASVDLASKRERGLDVSSHSSGILEQESMTSVNGSVCGGTAGGGGLIEVCSKAKTVITAFLQAYGNRSGDLFSVLLEILFALPVAVESPRLALSPKRRQMAAFGVLSQASLALGAACEMQRTAMRLEVSVCPRDFMQLLSLHESGNEISESRASQEVRLGALRCCQAWLDALTRFHKFANEAQQHGKLMSENPPSCIPGSARLLLCTPVVPLVLLNFLWECQRIILSDNKKPGADACEVPGLERHCNTGLVAELDDMETKDESCGTGTSGRCLLRASCDALVAVLDYLYALYSIFPVMLVPSAETEGDEMLALINWTNVDILRCMFYVASAIEALLHGRLPVHTTGTGTYRQPDMTVLRLIPTGVLKMYTLFLGKLVEIFLPAFIYSMQFDTLNDGLLLQPQEAEDAFHDMIAGMAGLSSVTPPQAPGSEERETTLRRSEALLQLMTDLLFHPALELRYLILEFWFSLTGNQFVQQQAQLETAAEQSAQALGYGQTQQLSLILPAFHRLVDTLVVISAFPSDITRRKDNFPFTAWLRFRDECSISLVDMSAVLSSYSIVEKAGTKLLKLLEGVRKAEPSVPLTGVPELWRDIEVCLFILTSVAPRAQVGEDQYIPMALEALPLLDYPQDGSLEALIMNTAAASLILWSAGYIGTRRDLFASCFRLLRCFIHALRSGSGSPKETALPNSWPRTAHNHPLQSYCDYCERVMVEALNAAVTAVAPSLTRDPLVPEPDVTYVLNGLADLILIQTLTMESRCSLVVSAGAVLQCLSLDKMQKYHYQLCDALHSRVLAGLPAGATASSGIIPKLSVETIQCLKLFFTALESVNPVYYVPPPPFSPNAAPLEPSSDYRHPVLNVIEEFWPLFRRCLLEFHASEMLIESTCHCVVQTFHLHPVHVVRYGIFGDFLEVLAASFLKTPSIFHLAALRSMLGIFGSNREEPVIRQLNDSLLTCTTYVLNAMQMTGVRVYVEQSPDIVGMILDCLNTALGAPGLTAKLMGNTAFSDALTLAISLTPECSHPKVLMTMLLLMTRFASFLELGRAGQPVATSVGPTTTAAQSTLEAERCLPVRQLCFREASRLATQLGMLEKMVHSALRAVTESYQGNIQWLGLVGTLFVDLLRNPTHRQAALQEIRSTLESAPPSTVPPEATETFLKFLGDAERATEHRSMCEALKQLAEQCSAHWQQSQFCSGKNQSVSRATNAPVAWA